MHDSHKIAPTGHYTAYAWHELGFPHADLFTTELGRRLFRAYELLEAPARWVGQESQLLRTLKNRHALIDRELLRMKPDLVVELGAGLSRRGVTFAADHQVRYVEVDLPAIVAYKKRLLAKNKDTALQEALRLRLSLSPFDIMADGFSDFLIAHLSGAERPVVVAEGVLGYFPRDAQRKLLESVHKALALRGAMLVDVRVKRPESERSLRMLRTAIYVATRGRGASESFASVEEVESLFRSAGFSRVSELEAIEQSVLSVVLRAEP